MNTLFTLARKEYKDGIRNRWVLAITILLALFALSLVFLGSAPVGETKASPIAITIVSLASLNIFLLPLIALLLAYDTIVGESENGTMLLLLSYPLSRWQVVLGKYLGQSLILATATLAAYAIAAAALLLQHKNLNLSWNLWRPYLTMTLSTLALGCAFLAIGYLISALARERARAAGMAIGAWLFFVLIYDIALLSALILDKGRIIGEKTLSWLLWANPADSYRLLNLGSGDNAHVAGMLNVGHSAALSPPLLILSLALWIILPLALAILRFQRKAL
ncbi:MAG: ABC transporter permease subunit [Cardiobacteriaceae bacterium]|nr:ABC transporter permease subunit [Cardiobacteriaceae bacterium]